MSLQGLAADPNSGLDAQQPSGFDESSPKNVSVAGSFREVDYMFASNNRRGVKHVDRVIQHLPADIHQLSDFVDFGSVDPEIVAQVTQVEKSLVSRPDEFVDHDDAVLVDTTLGPDMLGDP